MDNSWSTQYFGLTETGEQAGIKPIAKAIVTACQGRKSNGTPTSLRFDSNNNGVYLEVSELDRFAERQGDDSHVLLRQVIKTLHEKGWVILDKRQKMLLPRDEKPSQEGDHWEPEEDDGNPYA